MDRKDIGGLEKENSLLVFSFQVESILILLFRNFYLGNNGNFYGYHLHASDVLILKFRDCFSFCHTLPEIDNNAIL